MPPQAMDCKSVACLAGAAVVVVDMMAFGCWNALSSLLFISLVRCVLDGCRKKREKKKIACSCWTSLSVISVEDVGGSISLMRSMVLWYHTPPWKEYKYRSLPVPALVWVSHLLSRNDVP
eukprot:scaffold1511_cov170-Amphora_coffeaeformis.AAC.6